MYVCSDISLSEGYLGSRGGVGVWKASKNKLKDTNINFPMTNVAFFKNS